MTVHDETAPRVRETDDVTDSAETGQPAERVGPQPPPPEARSSQPPPVAPPGAASVTPPPNPPSVTIKNTLADLDRRFKAAKLPFDSFRSGAEWWFKPLIEARTWRAFGWLFVGAIWGPLLLALMLLIVLSTTALSITVVGLLLVIPAFAVINGLAATERARAAWVGKRIERPTFAKTGTSLWSMIGDRLTDAARWQQVLYLGLFGVVGPILFALGLLPWVLLLQAIFDIGIGPESFDIGGLLLAVLLSGGAARITVGVARIGRGFAESLLGPNDTVELQERVSELSNQRQQILVAVEAERRRIERNLHDGVQQQLVALGIDIGRARSRIDSDPEGARELLESAREKVRGSIGELRLIGRGLHPSVLEDRGLDAALSAVVAGSPIPIGVQINTTATLPDDTAATAYYVANEAVANILKHSKARIGSIHLDDDVHIERAVRLTIHDDGTGGADVNRGSGLAGMRARVEGVDGMFDIDSPRGGPTTVVAVLPIDLATTRSTP
jgi:signal transduction histidine kinase